MNTPAIKNTQSGGLVTGIVLLIVSVCICLTPFIFSLDMMRWGYGITCMGLFIFMSGMITFLMFLYRFTRLRAIINGECTIVRWTYSQEVMMKQVQANFEKAKRDNKFKLGIVWFFCILFTIIFLIIGLANDEDGMFLFVGMMMGMAGIITAFGLFMPYVMYWNAAKAAPVAIIATHGMYYMGQLHTWNFPLNYIDAITIDVPKKLLVFKLRYFTKLGWYKYESYTVGIPIPEGEMNKAREVVKKLNKG